MFGMFKKKPVPSGPITFDFDVLIERSPSEVYALVDWGDPRNAKRQLGHFIEGQSPRFHLRMTSMPDLNFTLDVIEEKAGEVYAYACDIEPRVGRLVTSVERFIFEPVGEGHCLLRLINEATFIDGMNRREFEQEMMMMSVATNDGLMKLKVMAELGLDAARTVENATFA
jgi:hypothetical protein